MIWWSDVVHVLRTSVDCTLLSRRDTTDDEREAGTPHCCTQCSHSVSWPLNTSSTLCSSVMSEWGHSLVVSTVSQMMLGSLSTQHPVTQCEVMSLNTPRHHPRTGQLLITDTYTQQWSYTGCQNSDSVSSSKFHHLALLALLVVLVSHILNFHHWPLLALRVVLVLH